MIVTSQCETCLLRDLCINRNQRLKTIEGYDWLYVTLVCNHKESHITRTEMDCTKCINRSICKLHNTPDIRPADSLAIIHAEIHKQVKTKLNEDAFTPVLGCKGYMIS